MNKICIPIRSFLLDYVKSLFKTDQNETILISAKNPLGHYLFSIIEQASVVPKSQIKLKYYLEVLLPERDKLGKSFDSRYSQVYISDVNIMRFNSALETMMDRELFVLLDNLSDSENGVVINKEIDRFMDKYNLVEHGMTLERFKKAYYRQRKKKAII